MNRQDVLLSLFELKRYNYTLKNSYKRTDVYGTPNH